MSVYWPEFLKLAVAHLLAVMTPGPDFAIVLRQSLNSGRRAGVWTALGVGTAILFHLTYSLFGLAVLGDKLPTVFLAVKIAGAAYLAWVGFQALTAKAPTTAAGEPAPASNLPGMPSLGDAKVGYRSGVLTNLLNPKAIVFFVAFFAAMVSRTTPASVRLLYGGWVVFATTAWFVLVAFLFTQAKVRTAFLKCGIWIDRTLGLVFIAFAILIAVAHR